MSDEKKPTPLEQLALRLKNSSGLSGETLREVLLELIMEVASIDEYAFARIDSLESEIVSVRDSVDDVDHRVDGLEGDVGWLQEEVNN